MPREIKLPQGLNVKSAVFCAIDGKLAGIFALSYTLPETVFPALEGLMLERVEVEGPAIHDCPAEGGGDGE